MNRRTLTRAGRRREALWIAASGLLSVYVAYLCAFWAVPPLILLAGLLTSAAIHRYRHQIQAALLTRSFAIDLTLLGGAVLVYWLLFARNFLSGKWVFVGDNASIFSADYLLYYSIQKFHEYPWWNPTDANGVPFYYVLGSYLQNPLSPLKLPGPLAFRALSDVFDVDINRTIYAMKTLYTFALNVTAFYLLARIVTRYRLAAVFGVLIFTLCYLQPLSFTDHVVAENLAAPLLLLAALLFHLQRPTSASLGGLVAAVAVFIASFTGSYLHSVAFWLTPLVGLIVWLYWARLRRSVVLVRRMARKNSGRIGLTSGALLLIAAATATALPILFNIGTLLRYRGGTVTLAGTGMLGSGDIPIETSPIWSLLFTWIPFSDVHEKLAHFSWSLFDYRYIGLATIPLIVVAVVATPRQRLVWALLLTFFLCNAFLIYSTNNLAYQALLDHVGLLRNLRNLSTIMPLGGAAILLIVVAILGADALLTGAARSHSGRRRVLIALLTVVALIAGIAAAFSFVSHAAQHSLAHIGAYLGVLTVLTLMAVTSGQGPHRRMLVLFMLALTFMDMTVSASSRVMVSLQKSPIISSVENFPSQGDETGKQFGSYRGYFYGGIPPATPFMASRAWLSLYSRPESHALLDNWDFASGTAKRFPFLELRTPPLLDARGKGTVTVAAMTLNSITAHVTTEARGFLYVADNYDRFWTATVDRIHVPVTRANFAFKAVPVEAGAHVVHLAYRAWPVWLAISTLYLALGLFALLWPWTGTSLFSNRPQHPG